MRTALPGHSGFLSVVEEGVVFDEDSGKDCGRSEGARSRQGTPLFWGNPNNSTSADPRVLIERPGFANSYLWNIPDSLKAGSILLSTPTHSLPQSGALVLDSPQIPCTLPFSLWK